MGIPLSGHKVLCAMSVHYIWWLGLFGSSDGGKTDDPYEKNTTGPQHFSFKAKMGRKTYSTSLFWPITTVCSWAVYNLPMINHYSYFSRLKLIGLFEILGNTVHPSSLSCRELDKMTDITLIWSLSQWVVSLTKLSRKNENKGKQLAYLFQNFFSLYWGH